MTGGMRTDGPGEGNRMGTSGGAEPADRNAGVVPQSLIRGFDGSVTAGTRGGFYLYPRAGRGRRASSDARRVRGRLNTIGLFGRLDLAEAPPHPEPSLRSDSDLS